MSFKTKRWAPYRTVTLSSILPGASPSKVVGSGSGKAIPWGGKILLLVYDATDAPIWAVYDPATNQVVAGPHTVTGLKSDAWGWHSDLFGEDRIYTTFGQKYLVSTPGASGYYFGSVSAFYGWDENFNFYQPDPLIGGRTVAYTANTVGWDGEPVILSYAWKAGNPSTLQALIQCPLTGAAFVAYDDSVENDMYLATTGASTQHGYVKLGAYYKWGINDEEGNLKSALYPSPPRDSNYLNTIARGSFGSSLNDLTDWGAHFQSKPDGKGAWVYAEPEGAAAYWADITAPLSAIELPCHSTWEYRGNYGLTLDEYDLDGVEHSLVNLPIEREHVTYNSALGWFVGVGNMQNAGQFVVYVLDPCQPTGRARVREVPGKAANGWVGEYAIGDDLRLAHVLPFPDERDPSEDVYPPIMRADVVLSQKEVFDRRGGRLTYRRPVQVQLEGYSITSEDWIWPGMPEGECFEGFWHMFAGNPAVIAFMPDPDWGAYGPVMNFVMRLAGVPTENLNAATGSPTHVVRSNQTVTGATFIKPTTSTVSTPRYQLATHHGGLVSFTRFCRQLQAMPDWAMVIGRVAGHAWETVLDVANLDRPGLGETNWTPRSINVIPPCRALPKGGFLIGAILYFDPWDEGEWEWRPGGRAATFTGTDGVDTGHGWVPAMPGYIGPLNTDDHHPEYFTAYDEWTMGRSVYGPDALLAYDHEGRFIECLNSAGLHAPNGAEVMLTSGTWPRLIFRVYRHGTYSDFAEGYGLYHRLPANAEIQMPLYAVYDLFPANGRLQPGAGTFRGFVDMYAAEHYSTKEPSWRWGAVGSCYMPTEPSNLWSPHAPCYVLSGEAGGSITILSPGAGSGRSGVKGVGRRA